MGENTFWHINQGDRGLKTMASWRASQVFLHIWLSHLCSRPRMLMKIGLLYLGLLSSPSWWKQTMDCCWSLGVCHFKEQLTQLLGCILFCSDHCYCLWGLVCPLFYRSVMTRTNQMWTLGKKSKSTASRSQAQAGHSCGQLPVELGSATATKVRRLSLSLGFHGLFKLCLEYCLPSPPTYQKVNVWSFYPKEVVLGNHRILRGKDQEKF